MVSKEPERLGREGETVHPTGVHGGGWEADDDEGRIPVDLDLIEQEAIWAWENEKEIEAEETDA